MPAHILLIGNGPSGEGHTLESVQANTGPVEHICRMNHFYVGKNFGNAIDDVFFAWDDPSLIANVYDAISSQRYQVGRFMTPLPANRLGPLSFLGVPTVNYWKFLPENDFFASIYLRGSNQNLPTSGIQALHYYLTQGFRKFTVVGMDFYSSPVRYAHDQEVKSRNLGDAHVVGYEQKAHSFQDDLNYFVHLAALYSFELRCLSSEGPWEKIQRICRQLVGNSVSFSFPMTRRLEVANG